MADCRRQREQHVDRHTAVGLAGTTVRLLDEAGVASIALFAHLVSADGFELLDCQPGAVALAPFGLLDTVPEPALRRARLMERHLIEAVTGLPPDAEAGSVPRPDYDPKWRTVDERLSAKAAECRARTGGRGHEPP
jgi:hypothetical protein